MSGYIGTQPVPQATQTRAAFTCTAGQTSFATGGYTPSFLDVFLNGVHLQNGTDYTAANGSDVVLTAGAALGDVLEVVAYSTFDSANTYTRSEADAEFVNDPDDVITVSGSNVGIGTTALNSNKAVIEGGSAGTHSSSLKLSTGGSANSLASDLAFYGTFVTPTADKDPRRTADITSGFSTANWGNEYLAFGVGVGAVSNDAANVTTERMRLDGSGSLRLGTLVQGSFGNKLTVKYSGGGVQYGISMIPTADNTVPIIFSNAAGASVGNIYTSSTTTTYNTTSDYRLKENITSIQGASDIVKAMNPCTYTFKADSEDWHDGFLAHELQELHPRAVIGEKDAVDEDGNPDYQGVDYSKLTPILTAALKEALNKIEVLEAQNAAFETRLAALEATP